MSWLVGRWEMEFISTSFLVGTCMLQGEAPWLGRRLLGSSLYLQLLNLGPFVSAN